MPTQRAFDWNELPRSRILRPEELIAIYAPDDPEVTSGQYDVHGFTPKERRAYERRLAAAERHPAP